MFEFIKKHFQKMRNRKIKVYTCNGITLYNFQDLTFDDSNLPEISQILDAVKDNLKQNNINLYMSFESFRELCLEVIFTDEMEYFMESLYLISYEYPEREFMVIPGDADMCITAIEFEQEDEITS